MASIRRTQSPYNHNGGNPFSVQSPSQKLLSNGKTSSPVTKFLGGIFFAKNSKKLVNISWRKSLYRCLMFFMLGFLLGMTPFGHIEEEVDLKRRESFDRVSFEMKQQPNVNNVVNLKEEIKDEVFARPESFVVDRVELSVDGSDVFEEKFDYMPLKQLIVVTPTYNRALQAYYLNRLGQVLRLVRQPILWIVVEMNAASMKTADLLRKTGVMYRHLVFSKNLTDIKDRGVHQRNRALEHIELHKLDGIVYFADDDNVYTLELFESLRGISRFGTWPVAMLAQSKNKAILEGPVCNGSQVIGWHTNEKSKRLRRFHVDMSGFAFNSTILWDPKRWKRPTSDPIRQLDTVKEGFQETTFIEQVVEDESQMEGIPSGCSKIMNWHLHLETRELVYPKGWLLQKNLDVVLPAK